MFPSDSARTSRWHHAQSPTDTETTRRASSEPRLRDSADSLTGELWLEEEGPGSTRVFSRPSLDPSLTVTLQGGIELAEVLGEGGMSLVRSATQVGLNRRVAVKMLPAEDDTGICATELMREAIVTGMLEHPNIVPVYASGHAPDGSPALVMKQIEGTHWSDVLADGSVTLNENIEILMTVCRAVHFAHTRGIVHRDIKPDNVMLGELGEIYVLDWGLAVTTRADLPEAVPVADDIENPAGTPAYWAPEMALGLSVDERTDVYLLGAALHEVITLEAPHAGATVHAAVLSAVSREPRLFSDATPTELAAICRKAMAYEPDDRFDTVEELRLALVEFLQHSASRRLAEEAELRSARLFRILATDDPETTTVHKLFTEARFAFKQALREWEDNHQAQFGLHRLLEKMAEYHISRESYDSARALVDELAPRRATLDERLLSLVDSIQKRNSEFDELRQLRADNDLGVAREIRRRLWWAMGGLFTVATLIIGAMASFDFASASYLHVWVITIVGLVGLLATQSRLGRALDSGVNRRFHRTLYGFILVAQMMLGACQIAGMPLTLAVTLLLVGLAGAHAMVAITFHRRYCVLTLTYLLGAAALALLPSLGFVVLAATFAAAVLATEVVDGRRVCGHICAKSR